MKLLNGKPLNIIELPMPLPVMYEGQRLPASYGNFYICNRYVIVPTFRGKNDPPGVGDFKTGDASTRNHWH